MHWFVGTGYVTVLFWHGMSLCLVLLQRVRTASLGGFLRRLVARFGVFGLFVPAWHGLHECLRLHGRECLILRIWNLDFFASAAFAFEEDYEDDDDDLTGWVGRDGTVASRQRV